MLDGVDQLSDRLISCSKDYGLILPLNGNMSVLNVSFGPEKRDIIDYSLLVQTSIRDLEILTLGDCDNEIFLIVF